MSSRIGGLWRFRSPASLLGRPSRYVGCLGHRPGGEGLLVAMVGIAGDRVAFGVVAIRKGTVDNMPTSHASAAIAQGSGMCSNKARRSNIMNRNAFL